MLKIYTLDKPKEITFSKAQVLALLGGTWPCSSTSKEGWPPGFSWEAVCYFKPENGRLVPYDSCDWPCPGPDFKLEIV